MKETLLKLYFMSPVWIQNLLVSFKGYLIKKNRFSPHFYAQLKFYQDFRKKPLQEQIQLEEDRLRLFLKAASESIFWKGRFSKYNVDIQSKDIKEELKKLPVLTKEEVKKNVDKIKIDNQKLLLAKTSGTTGSGLKFYETRRSEAERWAVWWSYRLEHGINLDQWYGWFGGMKIIKTKTLKRPYWRINYPEKRVMFSAYHLNANTVDDYASEIIKRKLTWLHGYPSQIALFSSLCLHKKYDFSFVKNITFGAESLLENQKVLVQKVFVKAKLTQHYGLAESVVNISQGVNDDLLFDRYFSYSEIVPTKQKNKYWLVGTNLSNVNFPLIRYKTNDIVEVVNNRIVSIDGRKEDYVVLKDGTKLGRLDHLFKSLIHIKEAQIFQESEELLIFRVVKGELYDTHNEETHLISEIESRFKNKIEYRIEYLKEIEKTKAGKLRFVISNIK